MTRGHVVFLTLIGVAVFLGLDFANSEPLNPYTAPPLMSLGSGLAATGAHCAAPPPSK
ncbi:hypothetical protein SAMN05444414_101273 [Roseovarius marisflavi]|uniref:Uncharacterized protein n=1 Tax=Roseovarius marisflavi TaxID=1054996 RepID=A0A1M6VF51_9RHOB|nr:hypothetical protein [Roseovarius marisflavi]SHK80069.1 hypothetical protein SAMN05444414_101273 [Roseovarius marisflavi]